jgi:AcrR family transcriptional regulator
MSKGQNTRAAILRQAVALARVQGIEGLSIGRLAERSGLSKSGLFGHFGSKEALQRAVLEAVVEEFRTTVIVPALREPTGLARLQRLFDAWLTWAQGDEKDGGCPLLGASIELDDRPGELRDYLVEKQQAWLDCIRRMTAKAVADGELHPGLDSEQFAFEFNAIGLGFHFAYRLLDDATAAERARNSFQRLAVAAATASPEPRKGDTPWRRR